MGRALILRVPSFAKVNLGLEVLGRRPDGYHDLRTIFQTISLHDDVELRPHPAEISVRCDHPGVPAGAGNLAHRAAAALREHAGGSRGVSIAITKRIPVAGGMGGGSSNAAAVLLGLDRMWRLGLGASGLHPIAARLGADVPFFLLGGTALGLGRGDEVYAVLPQIRAEVVVIDTGRPVSTAAVFRRIDAGLTPRENANKIFRFVSSQLEGRGNAFPLLSNDLERAALEEDPDLAAQARDIRGILSREGANFASLSGSGGSYFGLFSEADGARRAFAALKKAGFRAVRGRTLSLDRYRRMVGPAPAAPAGGRGSNRGRSGQHGDHGRQGHSRRR
jgi:4-diphosphocytidyl-2-C-methyl-D-erythritol kinase